MPSQELSGTDAKSKALPVVAEKTAFALRDLLRRLFFMGFLSLSANNLRQT
jgi:hypothetical protein